MTLRGLIETVEAGTATMDDFDAVFPPDGKPFKKAPKSIASIDAGIAFHGSLDAAKRLHDALLPGWAWMMGNKGTATVIPPEHVFAKRGTVGPTCRVDDNPARAWLLAILRALDADPREGGRE